MLDPQKYEFSTNVKTSLLVYTFVGTLFIQMRSIFIHLRVIYTIVDDFYTFEGSFIHLRELIPLRVKHSVGTILTNTNLKPT